MRLVFRFKNDLSLARMHVLPQGVKLVYVPHDDRLPTRVVDCASMEEALKDLFKASEQTQPFQCDFIYYEDEESE